MVKVVIQHLSILLPNSHELIYLFLVKFLAKTSLNISSTSWEAQINELFNTDVAKNITRRHL